MRRTISGKQTIIAGALAALVLLAGSGSARARDDERAAIQREVTKRHAESIKRLQDWIALPSIAAENRNYPAGAAYMARLAREAGFQKVTVIETDGKPGVFATLDAGAAKTVGLYFMYDVKQFDPQEWSSPPLEARVVDHPGFGKVVVGQHDVAERDADVCGSLFISVIVEPG